MSSDEDQVIYSETADDDMHIKTAGLLQRIERNFSLQNQGNSSQTKVACSPDSLGGKTKNSKAVEPYSSMRIVVSQNAFHLVHERSRVSCAKSNAVKNPCVCVPPITGSQIKRRSACDEDLKCPVEFRVLARHRQTRVNGGCRGGEGVER